MDEVKKIKRYEELDFTDDFLFCKIMQNNLDLCKDLTEMILDRKIGKIVTLNRQKSVEITLDGRGIRFDVYMEDDESNVYDIEMQTYKETYLPKRTRYYQGMIDLNMIERGSKFSELKKSYIVFICLANPYPNFGRHKYSIRHTCMEEPELVYEDEAFTIILSAEGNQEDVSRDMKDFLHYLATKEVGSDLTKRLEEKVQAARKHENWRLEYMTLLERDERMREEGRQEGEKTLADLINRLITEGRMDEVKRAVDDREFRKSLYAEYGINKK